jgi:hypothetical protein
MSKNYSSTSSFLRAIAIADLSLLPASSSTSATDYSSKTDRNLDNLKNFVCDLIVQTSFPLCLPFQKLLTHSASTKGESDKLNKSLKLVIESLKCVKEWKQCLKSFLIEFRERLGDESAHSDQTKSLIVANLNRATQTDSTSANKSESLFVKLNTELLTKHLPKFDVILNWSSSISSETASSHNDNMIRSFEIFTLYFDIFMSKSLTGNESDEDALVSDSLSLLQIDSLEQSLVRAVPKLLALEDLSDASASNLSMCSKYLKILIKYLSIQQSEHFMDERIISHFDSSDHDLIDLSLRVAASSHQDKKYTIEYRNVHLFNLVRVVYKFRSEASFQYLVSYYLKLIDVFLSESSAENRREDESSILSSYELFKGSRTSEKPCVYDKDYMYLWLLLAKKQMESLAERQNEAGLNLFIDYVYICLFNLLNSKQRNIIIFQMSLNMGTEESDEEFKSTKSIGFSNLLIFVCLKAFVSLSEKLNDDSGLNEAIYSFVNEFMFNSSLILADSRTHKYVSLKGLFKDYLGSGLLYNEAQTRSKELVKKFDSDLASKLKECEEQASRREKIKLSDGGKIKIKSLAQALMFKFQKALDLKSTNENLNIQVAYLNIGLRVRHLLYLLSSFRLEVKQ